jgi:hypothetical protein
MSRLRIALGAVGVLVVTLILSGGRLPLLAQAPAATRPETGDAAVSALVAEVRALRADLAAASRNQLRAQMLLGRVQMQEQRLAYLDKQRADTAAALMVQSQMGSVFRLQGGPGDASGCASMPSPEARRDCEASVTMRKQQLAEQEGREQQLRNQESELATALSAEQARWSDFNARLDELERAIR